MIFVFLLIGAAIGLFGGYLMAVTRTDRLLARMSPDELRALASRVRVRKGVN